MEESQYSSVARHPRTQKTTELTTFAVDLDNSHRCVYDTTSSSVFENDKEVLHFLFRIQRHAEQFILEF